MLTLTDAINAVHTRPGVLLLQVETVIRMFALGLVCAVLMAPIVQFQRPVKRPDMHSRVCMHSTIPHVLTQVAPPKIVGPFWTDVEAQPLARYRAINLRQLKGKEELKCPLHSLLSTRQVGKHGELELVKTERVGAPKRIVQAHHMRDLIRPHHRLHIHIAHLCPSCVPIPQPHRIRSTPESQVLAPQSTSWGLSVDIPEYPPPPNRITVTAPQTRTAPAVPLLPRLGNPATPCQPTAATPAVTVGSCSACGLPAPVPT